MRDYPEKDWKLFRQKLPGWQEAYMTRLCEEYMELLRSDKKGSERFWERRKVKFPLHRKYPKIAKKIAKCSLEI